MAEQRGRSDEHAATVEALCDRVENVWPAGVARQRAVLVAGLDALLAQAWEEGKAAQVGRAHWFPANPYRRIRPGMERPGESPCCPGAGSMAHVRGCRSHPEADRG